MLRILCMLVALVATATTALAQGAWGGYPAGYPYGQNGNAGHPNGYDGWPAAHPDNPNPGVAGKGGDGWGSGNGGKGGDGPVGGEGGNGGDNPGGRAGDGGRGGDGTTKGGCGGDGGKGKLGGDGGRGGTATGMDGEGGCGGRGGNSNAGFADGPGQAGRGGGGGDATGPGGCGGKGGDGGDSEVLPNGEMNGKFGMPGLGGHGVGGGEKPDPCFGDVGKQGDFVDPIDDQPVHSMLVPYRPYRFVDVVVASLRDVGFNPYTDPYFARWQNTLSPAYDWADLLGMHIFREPDATGLYRWDGMLHPDSLAAHRIRATIEYRIVGPNPSIIFDFGGGVFTRTNTEALPDVWMQATYTAVRNAAGDPFGTQFDQFTYEARDIEVRVFDLRDIGARADLNLDGLVGVEDLAIVAMNFAASGDLSIEDGDADQSGEVDATDLIIVIDGMNE